jgi:hypothetical protein
MNIYVIRPELKHTEQWHDVVLAQVIRAPARYRAIEIAKKIALDEGSEAWERASDEIIAENVKGDARLILASRRVH